jgi:hypothetical protein
LIAKLLLAFKEVFLHAFIVPGRFHSICASLGPPRTEDIGIKFDHATYLFVTVCVLSVCWQVGLWTEVGVRVSRTFGMGPMYRFV